MKAFFTPNASKCTQNLNISSVDSGHRHFSTTKWYLVFKLIFSCWWCWLIKYLELSKQVFCWFFHFATINAMPFRWYSSPWILVYNHLFFFLLLIHFLHTTHTHIPKKNVSIEMVLPAFDPVFERVFNTFWPFFKSWKNTFNKTSLAAQKHRIVHVQKRFTLFWWFFLLVAFKLEK